MTHQQFVHDYMVAQAIQFVFYAAVAGYQYYLLRRDRRRWAEQDAAREAKLLGEESRYSDTSKA
jgi:membrane protein implicated in regulation of membrane protease activity